MNDLEQWFVIRNPTAGNGKTKKQFTSIEFFNHIRHISSITGISDEARKFLIRIIKFSK